MQSRNRNSISPPAASKGRKRGPSNQNHIDELPEKKAHRNRAVNKDTGEGETRTSARLKGKGRYAPFRMISGLLTARGPHREKSDAFTSSEGTPTSLQASTKKRGAKGKQKYASCSHDQWLADGLRTSRRKTSDARAMLEVIPTSSSLQAATENRDAKGKGRYAPCPFA